MLKRYQISVSLHQLVSTIVAPQHQTLYSKTTVLYNIILPTGSKEREVLGVWSIHVVIVPSCQGMKTIAL